MAPAGERGQRPSSKRLRPTPRTSRPAKATRNTSPRAPAASQMNDNATAVSLSAIAAPCTTFDQNPTLFLRLPSELRVLVYPYIWRISPCPTMLKGLVENRDDIAWIGPHFNSYIIFSPIVFHMDPQIKREFFGELCRRFPLNVRIGLEHAPHVSSWPLKAPSSLLMDHVRRCNLDWVVCRPAIHARARNISSHFNNQSDLILLRTGLRKIIKILGPCSLLEYLTIILHFCRYETEHIILSTFHDLRSILASVPGQNIQTVKLLLAPWNVIITPADGKMKGSAGASAQINRLEPSTFHVSSSCSTCKKAIDKNVKRFLKVHNPKGVRAQMIPSTGLCVLDNHVAKAGKDRILDFDEYSHDLESFTFSIPNLSRIVQSLTGFATWASPLICAFTTIFLERAVIDTTAFLLVATLALFSVLLMSIPLGVIVTKIYDTIQSTRRRQCGSEDSCYCPQFDILHLSVWSFGCFTNGDVATLAVDVLLLLAHIQKLLPIQTTVADIVVDAARAILRSRPETLWHHGQG